MLKCKTPWLTRQVSTLATCVLLALSQPIMADSSSHLPSMKAWLNDNLSRNPQLQAARAAMDIAKAGVQAADRPLYNPELQLELERTDIDTRSAGISQTLDWYGKREARGNVARLQKEVSGMEYERLQQTLATRLLQALANWQTATDIIRVSEKQMQLMEAFADVAERRHAAGDLSQAELGLAHLAAANARFQLSSAETGQIKAKEALTAVTGKQQLSPPRFNPEIQVSNLSMIDVGKQLDKLPQIRAAKARIALATAGVTVKKREQRADPTVGLRLGTEDDNSLGALTLSIPLFVRNRFRAEVDQATATVIQVSREAAALRQETRARLQASAAVLQKLQNTWNQWQSAGAPILGQRTELLDRLWRAGEIRTTDYLVQLKQTLETETNAIEQRNQLWQAWTDWLSTSGEIEQWLDGES